MEKPSLTCYDAAEDGIKTRNPHLGKVRELVLLDCCSPVRCVSVHPVSTTSSQSVAVVERSPIGPLKATALCRGSNGCPRPTRWHRVLSAFVID